MEEFKDHMITLMVVMDMIALYAEIMYAVIVLIQFLIICAMHSAKQKMF